MAPAKPAQAKPTEQTPRQLLHLVFGGELTSLKGVDFKDLSALDIVGIYPNYARRAGAQPLIRHPAKPRRGRARSRGL